jgi:NADH:ubiquinone oxidoreductase subunit 4 (subunit M)
MGIFLFQKIFFSSLIFFEVISLFSLWGGMWIGILCFKQEDRKILIAYSRINHIALVIFGLIVGNRVSLHGAIYIMVGHGFVSSLLFFLNGRAYISIASRRGVFIKQSSRLLFRIWLFACFVNAGFPPFVNFLGEIIILRNVLLFPSLIPLLFLNFLVGVIYSVTLGRFFLKKKFSFLQKFTNSGLFFQFFISILHILPIFFILNLELNF